MKLSNAPFKFKWIVFLFAIFPHLAYSQGGALSFDGVNDRLIIPKNGNSFYNFNTSTSFTIEFWARSNAFNKGGGGFSFITDDTLSNAGFSFGIFSNKFFFNYKNTSGTVTSLISNFIVGSNSVGNDSNWHYYAVTCFRNNTQTEAAFYYDGRMLSTHAITNAAAELGNSNTNYIALGGRTYPSSLPIGSGGVVLIDELRIHDFAKSPTQILSGFPNVEAVASSTLMVYHKFNQGSVGGNNTSLLTSGIARDNTANTAGASQLVGFTMTGTTSNIVSSAAIIVPRGLSATNIANCGFTANWFEPQFSPSRNVRYDVQIATDSSFQTIVSSANVLSVSGTISYSTSFSNLSYNETYYVRVRGVLDDSTYTPFIRIGVYIPELITSMPSSSSLLSGQVLTLSPTPLTGTWSSANTMAIVFTGSNTILGKHDGSSVLTYTVGSGSCIQSKTVTMSVSNSKNLALSFDGSNDFIQISNPSQINLTSSNFTLEANVRLSSSGAGGLIFGAEDVPGNANSNAVLFGVDATGSPVIYFKRQSTLTLLKPSGTINSILDNYWHFVAVSVNVTSGTIRFYIDNQVYTVSNASLSSLIPTTTFTLYYIGTINNSLLDLSKIRLNGELDELRIWNIERSQSAIQASYSDTVVFNETGLVACYRFDQGVAATSNTGLTALVDYTSNNSHGTLQNFALSGSSSNWINSLAMTRVLGLSISNICGDGFRLDYTFQYPSLATDYVVDISENSTFSTFAINGLSLGKTLTTTRITNLDLNKLYYVRVRSVGSGQSNGAISDIVSATTSSCLFTFTGVISTDWNNMNNWSEPYAGFKAVPSRNDNVLINATSTPILSTDASVRNIFFATSGTPRLQLSSNAQDTLYLFGQILNQTTNAASTNGRIIGNNNANLVVASSTSDSVVLFMDNASTSSQTLGSLIINRKTDVTTDKLFIKNHLSLFAPLSSTNYAVVLLSDASGTCRIGFVNGTANFRGLFATNLFIPSGRRAFRFLSHPFSVNIVNSSSLRSAIFITGNGGSANGFDATLTNNPSAFSYVNGTGWSAWTNLNFGGANERWFNRTGLRILIRGDRTQTTSLTDNKVVPNQVTIPMFGSNFNDGMSPTINLNRLNNDQFNLVANPLHSNIILNNCVRTNVGNVVFLWNVNLGTRGAYQSFDLSNSTVIIPAFTSFFVTNTGSAGTSTGSIQFPESAKTASNSSVSFRKSNSEKVCLSLSDESGVTWDNLDIVLNQEASSDIDALDGLKMQNPDIDLFSLTQDQVKLSVDFRPKKDQVIALGIDKIPNGKYVLDFKNSNLPKDLNVYLKHKQNLIPVTNTLSYSFEVNSADSVVSDELFIVTGSTTYAEEYVNKRLLKLYPNPNNGKFSIEGLTESIEEIEVFDMDGKSMYKKTGNLSKDLSLQLPAGIYLCMVKTNSTIHTTRFLVID